MSAGEAVSCTGIAVKLDAAPAKAARITGYAPTWCATCPQWKSLLGTADIDWVASNAPTTVQVYPCFFVGEKFITSAYSGLTLAELKRRAAEAVPTQALPGGSITGKATIDNTIATLLATPLAKGNATLFGGQKLVELGDMKVVLTPTPIAWDMTGATKTVDFGKPFPRVRALGLVDIEVLGVVYDGTRLTVRLNRMPDLTMRVTE